MGRARNRALHLELVGSWLVLANPQVSQVVQVQASSQVCLRFFQYVRWIAHVRDRDLRAGSTTAHIQALYATTHTSPEPEPMCMHDYIVTSLGMQRERRGEVPARALHAAMARRLATATLTSSGDECGGKGSGVRLGGSNGQGLQAPRSRSGSPQQRAQRRLCSGLYACRV